MKFSARDALGYIAVGLTGLVFGYFGGREHMKYEMRSAIQSAVQGIQRSFAQGLPSDSSRSKRATAAVPSAPKPKVPPPVEITLTNKGFKASNVQAGDFEDDITIELSIKNLTGSDIRAFDGTLIFTDLLDNQIISLPLAINDPVKSGATVNWRGALKYNQFMDEHQHLRNEALANVKTNFIPKKVLFADGTSKEYE